MLQSVNTMGLSGIVTISRPVSVAQSGGAYDEL